MSESGDKEFPTSNYGYLNTRALLLLNLNLLRQELNWLWERARKFNDKRFDTHLQTIAERRREILLIAHEMMSIEDYKKYEDFVNTMIPTQYSKMFDLKKLGPKKRKF